MSTETTTIYDDCDNPISVEFDYTPGCRCTRFEFGAPMDPDDPEEWDLISATDKADECVELTDDQIQEAIEQIQDGE
jgi:hypothetical protein